MKKHGIFLLLPLFMSLALVGLGAGAAGAAGFAIIEQSVTGLGNAFAGGAASAEDATTVYFNPAGMTRLDRPEFVVAGHVIIPSAEFENNGSTHVLQGITGIALQGGNGGDAGVTKVVPNLYYVRAFKEKYFFGLGVNAPFGLATDYDSGWVGRYHALKSEVSTVNINPAFAMKVWKGLSLGVGLDIQYIDAELSQAIDYGTIDAVGGFSPLIPAGTFGLTPQGDDGTVVVKGDNWGFGFNIGALYEFSGQTRIGLHYRSRIDQELSGDADFRDVPAGVAATLPAFQDTGVKASIALPDTISGSIHHDINEAWSVMADVTWTNWSLFRELRIEFDNANQPDSVVTTAWKDSWRYSAGVTFRPTKAWTVRGGVAFDETPIPDAAHRTPRIPGEDRTWLALGGGYRITDSIAVDIGYAHLFVNDPKVDKDPTGEDATRGGLKGTWDASVDIVSAQLTWKL